MYLGTNGKYKFFAEEVDRCPPAKLKRISEACEKVEQDVWNACENFSKYLTKQSALVYAKEGELIIGFALFDLSVKNGALVVAANECMVMKAHQGFGLPNLFASILASHVRQDQSLRGNRRPYKYITFISATVNFKLMEAFKRYSYFIYRSSFRPDQEIVEIANEYMKKENFERIVSTNPFFVKGAFPNASKHKASIDRPNYVPVEFESQRGDAFLFVSRVSSFKLLSLMSWVVRQRYGFRFSKRILPISRITRESVIYTR
jgi:hypothetical protein